MMDEADTFKIIISTDNHLGYLERDPIRGNDSFITFEEILKFSNESSPDFILLGGDLFHENKPSLSSLFKCSELIRKYAFNNNETLFSIVSDESQNFSHSEYFKHANFSDSNLNVGLPIFTIHGNHDDQIDQTNLCALDLFHASGLVNLFGKYKSVESIEVRPILMQKGTTKLAIYGLGAMKNERLHRLFQQNKITFLRPSEDTDDWFSIFVIHQNRVKHGTTNFIPENYIPEFIDLVFWGHEHDCRIDPEWNNTNEFYVIQPGSSVATSLSEGESLEKYIGVLEVRKREFKVSKVKLNTVRPFVIDSIVVADDTDIRVDDEECCRKMEQLCHIRVQNMIMEAQTQLTVNEDQPTLPLIRFKVDYSGGYEMFSTMRFSQEYVGKVANPKDLLLLHRKKEQLLREAMNDHNIILDPNNPLKIESNIEHNGQQNINPIAKGLDQARVEDMVKQYFCKVDESMKLNLLSEIEMGVGVQLCVDKDNDRVLNRVVDLQLEKVQSHLKETQPGERQLSAEIKRVSDQCSKLSVSTSGEGDGDGDLIPMDDIVSFPATSMRHLFGPGQTEQELREQLIREFPGSVKREDHDVDSLMGSEGGQNYEKMMLYQQQQLKASQPTPAPKRGRPKGSRSRGRRRSIIITDDRDSEDEVSTMSSNSINYTGDMKIVNDYEPVRGISYRKRRDDDDEDYIVSTRGTRSKRRRSNGNSYLR